jgi:hypothetical protein
MNLLEKQMLDVLKDLKDNYGVIGIKAEFEAEGTRIDELLRLVEIVRKLNLKLGIKIGGCEAMKDLMECKQIGTEYIIAPMVETDNLNNKYEDIDRINGWVFGRVDYTLSSGLDREDINREEKVTKKIIEISKKALDNKLNLVVGGGISVDALEILKNIKQTHLSRFETRKVIFSSDALKIKNLSEGMLKAVNFELLWLKNKKNYYGSIFKEDDKRIDMLSKRWKV